MSDAVSGVWPSKSNGGLRLFGMPTSIEIPVLAVTTPDAPLESFVGTGGSNRCLA